MDSARVYERISTGTVRREVKQMFDSKPTFRPDPAHMPRSRCIERKRAIESVRKLVEWGSRSRMSFDFDRWYKKNSK